MRMLSLLIVAVVVACGRDQGPPPPSPVGAWYLVSIDADAVPVATPGAPCDSLRSSYLALFEDGTFLLERTYATRTATGAETCYAPLADIGTYLVHESAITLASGGAGRIAEYDGVSIVTQVNARIWRYHRQ